MIKSFKKLHIITLSLILAVICSAFYCLTYYQKPIPTQIATRNIEVSRNAIDYEAYFEQFDSVNFVPDGKLSTLNLVQTVDEDFLSEINNNSSTTHYKGEVCYDIDYDHDNGKVHLNATLYLDDEGNCLFEKVEGVACWNENIKDIDIVFEAEDEIVFLSDLNEDINNCGWFKKALKFVKKNAVAIVATVAVVAVVATVVVAAPALVAAATATISVGGGAAGLTGGISAGLVAAGSAIASSTLVTATVAAAVVTAGVAIGADIVDNIIEYQSGSISIGNTYTICGETDDEITRNVVKSIYETASLSTLLKVGKAYHIAFVVSNNFSENGKEYNVGNLYISPITLSFAEAYTVLVESGMVNSINNLTSAGGLIGEVTKTVITGDMKSLIDLIKTYKTNGYFSKKIQGIYADSVEAAAILATVTGAWIKSDGSLVGRGCVGGYNHFHDLMRTIHIWYGSQK